MKTKILFLAAAAAMAFTAASCSKDDGGDPSDPRNKVPDPEGTVELNMRNMDNGKTLLECKSNSGTAITTIYIDKANNFGGMDFVDLGEMSGLGNIVKFTTTGASGSCSVCPGHGYLAFYSGGTRRFPSGATAYNVEYAYRIYVDSWITGTSGGILGAKIKYQYPFNPYGLPLTWVEYGGDADAKGWEADMELLKNSITGLFYGSRHYIRSNDMYISFIFRN